MSAYLLFCEDPLLCCIICNSICVMYNISEWLHSDHYAGLRFLGQQQLRRQLQLRAAMNISTVFRDLNTMLDCFLEWDDSTGFYFWGFEIGALAGQPYRAATFTTMCSPSSNSSPINSMYTATWGFRERWRSSIWLVFAVKARWDCWYLWDIAIDALLCHGTCPSGIYVAAKTQGIFKKSELPPYTTSWNENRSLRNQPRIDPYQAEGLLYSLWWAYWGQRAPCRYQRIGKCP